MEDRTSWLVAALSVWLVPAAALPAEEAPATDFFETVEVNVVNVEVYVTDKKGNPITGLTAADFELYEDGERVEISNFYTAEGEAAAAAARTAVAPGAASAPVSVPVSVPAPGPVPEDQRLKLVIFVDNLNVRPMTRNRVLKAFGESFFQLRPEDEVMVVSYNGGGLDVRQPLSTEPEDVLAAIVELTEVNPRGTQRQIDRISIMRELQQIDLEEQAAQLNPIGQQQDTTDWQGIFMQIQNYAQQQYQESVRTVDALSTFVDSLSGLPGRKALIYVSDGLSLRPGEALYHAWNDKQSGAGESTFTNIESQARETDITPLLEELGKHANANRVTFYTVLASGGQTQTITAAERSAFVNINSADAATLGQVWSDRLETMEASNYRGSMQIMAEATGGVATLNTTAFDSALERLRRDFSTYYSLGYVSPIEADGKDHKIKVKMKDKTLRVRHREGYRAKTGDQRMADQVKSALLFENLDNPLQVVVGFGEEKQDKKGRYLVPIMVKFPLASLLLLPQEHFHEGRVSIYVGARDADGGISPVQRMPAPIRIPNDQLLTALGQVAGFRVTLLMREGEHSVVVGVRDELANVESTTRVAHTPGQPQGAEIAEGSAPGAR